MAFKSTKEVLKNEEKARKEDEKLLEYKKNLQEIYIVNFKSKLNGILNCNKYYVELCYEIDKTNSLFGYEINYNRQIYTKNIFNIIDKLKLKSNQIRDEFLKLGENFIKHFFLEGKISTEKFKIFLLYIDLNKLTNLLIVCDFYNLIPDNYKKIFIENTNESIHGQFIINLKDKKSLERLKWEKILKNRK